MFRVDSGGETTWENELVLISAGRVTLASGTTCSHIPVIIHTFARPQLTCRMPCDNT